MTKDQALKAQQEIEDVCKRHNIWYEVVHEKKPDVAMIRIQDIKIKIDQPPKGYTITKDGTAGGAR